MNNVKGEEERQMGDLKSGVDDYVGFLERRVEEMREELRRMHEAMRQEAGVVAGALCDARRGTGDLIESAKIALVREIDLQQDTHLCRATLSTESSSAFDLFPHPFDHGYMKGPKIERGRYRLLFFVLSIDREQK